MADDLDRVEARLLFLSASEDRASRISVDREYSRVKEALQRLGVWARWREAVEHQPAVTWEQFPEQLLAHRASIVHFAGHGHRDGSLEVAKRDGGSERIQVEGVARLLTPYAGQVRLVVLNACYSDRLATALIAHVDVVVGNTCAISDEAAILFAPAFYQQLAGGHSVQAAFDVGVGLVLGRQSPSPPAPRRDLEADLDEDHPDRGVPHLRVRSGIDASRLVFSPPRAARRLWMLPVGGSALAVAVAGAWWIAHPSKSDQVDPTTNRVDGVPVATSLDMVRVEGGAIGATAVPGFWIARTELGQDEWQSVMPRDPSLPQYGSGGDHPANNMTWDEAIDAANKLSARHARTPCYVRDSLTWTRHVCTGYRLPTDLEWRYLRSRSGPVSCAVGNVADESLQAAEPYQLVKDVPGFSMMRCNDGFPLLAPVRSLQPDQLGLYQLEGNVAEWIWNDTETSSPRPAVRGTSFLGGSYDARSAPEVLGLDDRRPNVGARYARDAD
jgi:formylglycine-generating enzyme required for sulfatase activity